MINLEMDDIRAIVLALGLTAEGKDLVLRLINSVDKEAREEGYQQGYKEGMAYERAAVCINPMSEALPPRDKSE